MAAGGRISGWVCPAPTGASRRPAGALCPGAAALVVGCAHGYTGPQSPARPACGGALLVSRLASTTLRIGDLAPDFTLPALDGAVEPFSKRLQASHILLVFAPGSWSP